MPKENLLEVDYFFNRYYFRPIGSRLVPIFAKSSITPNQLTILAFVIGLASAFSFWSRSYLIGAVLIHLQIVFDVCDGGLARYKGLVSKFGAKLDATLDTSLWFILFLALALSTEIEDYLLIGVWVTLIAHLVITRYLFPHIAKNTTKERWFNKWFVRQKLRFGFDEVLMLIMISVLAPFRLIIPIFWITMVGRNFDWIYRLIETEKVGK